jgi:hypothetical protein|tara:strand:- start:38 stop:550 length:513 start_codon:yes stop_codon:yes gene_type:complete
MSQLKVNSIVPVNGLPAGSSGGIIQVKQTVKTDEFSNSTQDAFFDLTGINVSITPSSNSNKILVLVNLEVSMPNELGCFRLLRDSTVINLSTAGSSINGFGHCDGESYNNSSRSSEDVTCCFLDSPATTSSVTYKVQLRKNGNSTMRLNRRNLNGTVGWTSTITAMEVTG